MICLSGWRRIKGRLKVEEEEHVVILDDGSEDTQPQSGQHGLD